MLFYRILYYVYRILLYEIINKYGIMKFSNGIMKISDRIMKCSDRIIEFTEYYIYRI